MAIKSVKFETDYDVGAGDVTLNVIIGNKQFGTSAVSLQGESIVIGDVNDLVIPANGGLTGKDLFIKSVVTDVNDISNITSIRYMLSGGATSKQFDLSATVEQEGDSVVYRTTIHFV